MRRRPREEPSTRNTSAQQPVSAAHISMGPPQLAQGISRWMRPLAWFITPIAVPAWLLEALYRRIRRRFWEFNTWSGTFYLLALVLAGLALLLSPSLVPRVI